jgi:hypothetical protein
MTAAISFGNRQFLPSNLRCEAAKCGVSLNYQLMLESTISELEGEQMCKKLLL